MLLPPASVLISSLAVASMETRIPPPHCCTKSLPAEAVERIEVYNKLSDQAEFSGMDDGESYKAINIVTRENMRQGIFGKAYAGYGYDADTETEA